MSQLNRSARPHGRARIETEGGWRGRTRWRRVAPGLTAGRGLKPVFARLALLHALRVAPGLTAGRGLKLDPRPDRPGGDAVAPGLTAGRGLKLDQGGRDSDVPLVAPGLTAGRGLKLRPLTDDERARLVAPGLTAGRGLKLSCIGSSLSVRRSARPHGRARIETSVPPVSGRKSAP